MTDTPSEGREKTAAELELAQTLASIDRGLEDIKAGRVQDAREAMREIAKEHGIKLDPKRM